MRPVRARVGAPDLQPRPRLRRLHPQRQRPPRLRDLSPMRPPRWPGPPLPRLRPSPLRRQPPPPPWLCRQPKQPRPLPCRPQQRLPRSPFQRPRPTPHSPSRRQRPRRPRLMRPRTLPLPDPGPSCSRPWRVPRSSLRGSSGREAVSPPRRPRRTWRGPRPWPRQRESSCRIPPVLCPRGHNLARVRIPTHYTDVSKHGRFRILYPRPCICAGHKLGVAIGRLGVERRRLLVR